MTGAGMPGTVAEPDFARLGQEETPPGTASRKSRAGFSSELERQRDFFPAVLVTQNDRTDLASMSLVKADDLSAMLHRLFEELVRRTRHCIGRQAAAVTLAGADLGLKVSATATEATPTVNEPR